jgi:hypothetical protein
VIADHITHRDALDIGEQSAVEQRQPVGRVIRERVSTLLRLKKQGEGGVALDVLDQTNR